MIVLEDSSTIMTETGETIDQLQEAMFNLMKKTGNAVFGLFNGQPYICPVDCDDKSKIGMF